MRYWIKHHQHKGKPFVTALKQMGWEYSQNAEITLLDTAGNQKVMRLFAKRDSTFVLYPHTAVACWWYDTLMELPERVKAILVIGEGQKEVQEIITPQVRVEVCGWGYCKILPFKRPKKVKRILFAPIHPSGSVLREEAKQTNAAVYKRLLELKGVQIVVRYIGKPQDNGLWYSPKVIMVRGKPDGSTAQIDNADLVIAEGMYLHLAVARGKPAIGLNQHIPNRVNRRADLPQRWNEYGDLMAYPIDWGDGDIIKLIDRALDESAVSEWKRRFIGEPLDPKKLAELLIDIRGTDNAHKKRTTGVPVEASQRRAERKQGGKDDR